jgi:anaphase-promoting complex subunit 8
VLIPIDVTDFEAAERAFDEVRKIDPFRLDEIEIYSNMLYVMGKKAKLGQMAHEYAQVNKNRAEVCCLIGEFEMRPVLDHRSF